MRLVLHPDLDDRVAQMIVPDVNDVIDAVRSRAMLTAPDGLTWQTVRDERVRPAHRDVDFTLIPANLPFILHDEHGRAHEAKKPRDPKLPIELRINCRCEAVTVPGAVARSLQAEHARAVGTSVSGKVTSRFERVAESEAARDGGGWFLGAARQVARERRGE